MKGATQSLIHKWWDGTAWSNWEDLGGVIRSSPGVASWGSGRLDVFARGQDNKLWQRTYDKGWSGWMGHAGCELVGGPAAVSWDLGRIDVLSMTYYGDLVWKYHYDSVWHP